MRVTPAAVARALRVERRYLHIPVRTGDPMRRVRLSVGRIVQRWFDIELAQGEPEWWAFIDLTRVRGESILLALEGEGPVGALDAIHQSDEIVGSDQLYREARRPQLTFSSRRGWLNDPVGLVFLDGEYHLFYQHNPYGTSWGNMHWGHAVSRDLVHWQELPVSLYPDELGAMFSGSVVVDRGDTAELQRGAEPPLIAIYTAAGEPFTQCIAASSDRGRTWEKYSGNPVLSDHPPSSRDPRVFWHRPTGRWVMALFLDDGGSIAGGQPTEREEAYRRRSANFALYASSDLRRWARMSDVVLPDDGECPELFELPIQGRTGETRWIFMGASGRYLVGSFDGATFVPEAGPRAVHQGEAFYASQTFNDIPASDGRRILISWRRTPGPGAPDHAMEPMFAGMPFSQSMGLPVELTLHGTADGHVITVSPVVELERLRRTTTRIPPRELRPGDDPLTALRGELWEIDACITVGTATRIVVEARGLAITYDVARRELLCRGTSAPLAPVHGRLRLRIFVDRTAIDIFGQDGLVFMPMAVDLSSSPETVSLRAEGGTAEIVALDVHELTSIWP
jgi:sucrose-6-phosphate hydrolase SacC (GH32 family)